MASERRTPVIAVRWAREKGYIEARRTDTGETVEIAARDAPQSWRDELFGKREERRRDRGGLR